MTSMIPLIRTIVVSTCIAFGLVACNSQAAPPSAPQAWTATGTLAADEAHQAAATDLKFVYAITNTQVAKYDRLTKKRVAVSTGEAKHLNSGFLHSGKLYCAHSNYPQTPERSEIKVLDLETMKLATFKDFGSFGGSLTWGVHHDAHWWCNFARYGDDNKHTFLVKFDPEWKEKARWTYPAEVIRELSRNSLSGGIWRDGELFVTGHDDPVLFRLRLPKQGSVLELVGKQSIPFTGQGIAHDPKTGGLVGINRAKRQVVFASLQDSMPLRLAHIFADHMVLQRELPVRVWGWAVPGQSVSVEFAGQQATTKAGADSMWQITLQPLKASAQGRDLQIRSGKQSVTVRDVVVGEVWHASGQSNMAMTVGDVAKQLDAVKVTLATADLPQIRFCRISDGESPQPLEDLRTKGDWTLCSPSTASGFSAVAFFFACHLHKELNVPVGVIDTSRGGTPIEPFISRVAFDSHPTLRRERELGDKEDLQAIWRMPGGVRARDANWLPGRLFHSRLAPIARFAVRGAIWYQGESNCGLQEDPRDYQHKMRALINGWRGVLQHKEMPFYFVQLPGSGASEGWPYLREQQRLSADLPGTGMVVTVDLEGKDIHPPNKIDVGQRLASWALAKDYGNPTPYSGPLFAKAAVQGDKITVQFAHAESGLMVAEKRGLGAPVETPNAKLRLFEVADEKGDWFPAQATIVDETVVVRSDALRQPVAVRYAYRVTPEGCNLYNRDELPASPFCSRPELLRYDPKLPQE